MQVLKVPAACDAAVVDLVELLDGALSIPVVGGDAEELVAKGATYGHETRDDVVNDHAGVVEGHDVRLHAGGVWKLAGDAGNVLPVGRQHLVEEVRFAADRPAQEAQRDRVLAMALDGITLCGLLVTFLLPCWHGQ
ncbi:hypothetical protein ACFU96_43935 [Streptomyces sp. NPDC057620]|uniref:hypothetical protein n=1 Tax=Streptomyces sp. NPDC057620 TaxID=3346185 RepID=UPI0036AAE616